VDFFSKSTFLLNLIFTTLAFEADTPKGRQKDCDARWTKKNNETHYGYKNHAKVDAKSKLVGGYTTTPANVHDSKVLEELVDENDEAVFADSAYQSEASEAYLHSRDCQNFILFKARRGHPLSEEEQATNKRRSPLIEMQHAIKSIVVTCISPMPVLFVAWSRREDGNRSQDISVLKCMQVAVMPDLLADRNVRAPFLFLSSLTIMQWHCASAATANV